MQKIVFTIVLLLVVVISALIFVEKFVYPVAASGSGMLVVSELMPNPTGDDAKLEWIELHNQADTEVNLTGWTLNGISLPEKVIPVDGFLVLVRDEVAFKSAFSTSSSILKSNFSLANAGGKVTLTHIDGSVFEFVYTQSTDGVSFELLSGSCGEIAKHPTTHSVGSTNTSCDFQPPDSSSDPTSTETIFQQVIIASVLPYPEAGDEWLELQNLTSEKINLSDWKIYDESNRSFKLTGQTLDAFDVLRVFPKSISLNNDKDVLRLIDGNARQVDVFVYNKPKKGEILSIAGFADDLTAKQSEEIEMEVKEISQITGSVKSEQAENFNRYFKLPILYRADELKQSQQ